MASICSSRRRRCFSRRRDIQGGWTGEDWGPVRFDQLFRERALAGWRIVQQADSLVVVEDRSSVSG